MKNLIIPCAGQSTRFPGMPPKYLLTHPTGGLLLWEGIKGLEINNFEKIYITILKTHDKEYNAFQIIVNSFIKTFPSIDPSKLVITLLENTKNQPDTIRQTIERQYVKNQILIKDCDDYFKSDGAFIGNSVCYYPLSKIGKTNASNKSYITIDSLGYIDNIVEKRVISEEFCCGGYSFQEAQEFIDYYYKLCNYENLYVSHIIGEMLRDGKCFVPIQVENYIDWGTLEDWEKYKSEFNTLFIDLDGTLVENSSEFGTPKWGETKQIKENCDVIRGLYNEGKTQIIITTARREEYTGITYAQLSRENIPFHKLIMNLYHGKRYIINDYSNTNKYPSCEAINLERNSNKLKDLLS